MPGLIAELQIPTFYIVLCIGRASSKEKEIKWRSTDLFSPLHVQPSFPSTLISHSFKINPLSSFTEPLPGSLGTSCVRTRPGWLLLQNHKISWNRSLLAWMMTLWKSKSTFNSLPHKLRPLLSLPLLKTVKIVQLWQSNSRRPTLCFSSFTCHWNSKLQEKVL